MKTDIIPIVIGVSLCSASAVLLYIWYKTKDKEDVTDSPSTKTAKSSGKTKVECTIPNNVVPLVVGRNGANIESIEAKTNTKILFKPKDDYNHICEITGTRESVKAAVELVKQEATPQPNLTETMLVPQSSCGKIIGRCGEALQEICRKSLAKVHVEPGDQSDGDVRRVLITGTRAHVNMAKSLIEEKIRLDEESRKDSEIKREPRGNAKKVIAEVEQPTAADPASTEIVSPKREKFPNADGQMEVYVSAVASPSRFWIQLVGKQSVQLDQLIESMSEYYDKPENHKNHKIADPYLGQIVAALFKYDSKWYRAEIVAILPNDYNPRNVILDLYFVDFGDSEYVNPSEVYELRTEFLTLRFQAIECFLANVKPKNKNEDDIWDDSAIAKFENLTSVASWRKMNARIVATKKRKHGDQVKRDGSPIPGLELFRADAPKVSVAKELVAKNFADEIVPSPDTAQRGENVVRLDGGCDDSNDTKSIQNIKKIINRESDENDKLTTIIGTNGDSVPSLNGNAVARQANGKNNLKSFIDAEKSNGTDRNSNFAK